MLNINSTSTLKLLFKKADDESKESNNKVVRKVIRTIVL